MRKHSSDKHLREGRELDLGEIVSIVKLGDDCPDASILFPDIDMPGSMDGTKLAAVVCAGLRSRLWFTPAS